MQINKMFLQILTSFVIQKKYIMKSLIKQYQITPIV